MNWKWFPLARHNNHKTKQWQTLLLCALPNTLQIFSECFMMGVGQPAQNLSLLFISPNFLYLPKSISKTITFYSPIYWIIELCYFWHNKIPLFYLIRTQSAQNLTPLISPCPYIYPIGSNFCHLLIRKFPGSNSSYHPIRLKIYILVGTHYWMETGRKPVSGFVHVWLFCSFEFFGFYAQKNSNSAHFLKEWISVILEVMELEALCEQV